MTDPKDDERYLSDSLLKMIDSGEMPMPKWINSADLKYLTNLREERERKEKLSFNKIIEAFFGMIFCLGMTYISAYLMYITHWLWFLGLIFFGSCTILWFKEFLVPITAEGEQGNANRSTLMLIGLFLLILVIIVFGTILVLKN